MNDINQNPEQVARDKIDAMLRVAGREVQHRSPDEVKRNPGNIPQRLPDYGLRPSSGLRYSQ